MIGTILIAAIGYGLAGFTATVGVLLVAAAFSTERAEGLLYGMGFFVLAFGVAMLTRWAVGL